MPMGTANALAHDIGLPQNLTHAAKAALRGVPRRIALGRVKYADANGNPASKYFVVAAGVGVDAHLFYKLHSGTKQRMGMGAYYAKAWNLWFTYPMPRFAAEFVETGSDDIRRAEVTELLSVRIRNFGGIVQELAPGASLDRDDMRLILCRSASRLTYLAYVARCVLRRQWTIRGIDLAYGKKVSCEYLPSSATRAQPKIYVEADGELLGSLPIEITMVPDALTLLAPPR
jgi:diacylglycerol kinase family enzyme